MTTPEDFLNDWAKAELAGNKETLNDLLSEDFLAVGPLGFTLSKQDWIDRHAPGKLQYDQFAVSEPNTTHYGEVAVVVGIQHQEGTFSTGALPTQLRTTFVLARASATWRIANIHMSFMAGTPGSPPLPGRPPQK